jgi:hypothetical protein
MVATILKKVTSKGIEAATNSVSSSSSASNAPISSSIDNGPSFLSASELSPDIQENSTVKKVDIQHSSSLNLLNDDGYLGKVSGYVTDALLSGKEYIFSASDEASKQLFSNISNNFVTLVYTPSKTTNKNNNEIETKNITSFKIMGNSPPKMNFNQNSLLRKMVIINFDGTILIKQKDNGNVKDM